MSQVVSDYKFGTKPYDHQVEAFLVSRERESFAYLMEQGTGKSKVAIDNFCWLYQQGKVNGVLIVCPKNVVKTWAFDQIPTHVPAHVEPFLSVTIWRQRARAIKKSKEEAGNALEVLVMNHDAFLTDKGLTLAKKFCLEHSVFMLIDESTCIKSPTAKRSKVLQKIGLLADYRRIATGTPVANSPFDIYSQFKFLDPEIVETSSFTSFKGSYGVAEPRRFRAGGPLVQVNTGYQNLDQLNRLIAPHSFFAYKKDCLDLPDKVYKKIYVELSSNQRKAYEGLKHDACYEFDQTNRVSATLALTCLLRFQQITSGWVNLDERQGVRWLDKPTPKLTALMDLLATITGKVIIWANYKTDIETIAAHLMSEYGPASVATYYGETKDKDRDAAEKNFQDHGHPLRFFVGNPQAGGMGLTLTQAETVIYYSNSYKLLDRQQSEDRAHRIGQKKTVTYYDLIAEDTVDERIVDALRNKRNLAAEVTGASLSDWL